MSYSCPECGWAYQCRKCRTFDPPRPVGPILACPNCQWAYSCEKCGRRTAPVDRAGAPGAPPLPAGFPAVPPPPGIHVGAPPVRPLAKPGMENYTEAEVRAILDALAEGRNPNPPAGGGPEAHSMAKHWALTDRQLKYRACADPVNYRPAVLTCFRTFDDMVRATTAALNSAQGRAAIQSLDAGQNQAVIGTNALPVDISHLNLHVPRLERVTTMEVTPPHGTANLWRNESATHIFVKIYKHQQGAIQNAAGALGGAVAHNQTRLWIQTSYPKETTRTGPPQLLDHTFATEPV